MNEEYKPPETASSSPSDTESALTAEDCAEVKEMLLEIEQYNVQRRGKRGRKASMSPLYDADEVPPSRFEAALASSTSEELQADLEEAARLIRHE